MARVLGPKDSIGDSVLSSHVDPGMSLKSAGLHGKCLDPLSHLTSCFFVSVKFLRQDFDVCHQALFKDI